MTLNALFKGNGVVGGAQETAIVLLFKTQLDSNTRFEMLDFIMQACGMINDAFK